MTNLFDRQITVSNQITKQNHDKSVDVVLGFDKEFVVMEL